MESQLYGGVTYTLTVGHKIYLKKQGKFSRFKRFTMLRMKERVSKRLEHVLN